MVEGRVPIPAECYPMGNEGSRGLEIVPQVARNHLVGQRYGVRGPVVGVCKISFIDARAHVAKLRLLFKCDRQVESHESTCECYFWLVASLVAEPAVLSSEEQSELCPRLADLIGGR